MNLSECAEKVGFSQPTLTRWIQKGLVRPPDYRGRRRVEVNVTPKIFQEFCVIAQLRRAGLNFQVLQQVGRYLRSLDQHPFSRGKFVMVVNGALVKMCAQEEAIELLKRPGQLVIQLEEP